VLKIEQRLYRFLVIEQLPRITRIFTNEEFPFVKIRVIRGNKELFYITLLCKSVNDIRKRNARIDKNSAGR